MRKLDHEAERNKIAAVAAELMAERGAANITLQMVADKLDSTRGRVMHYFSSKQQVIEAAFEWANQQVFVRVPDLLTNEDADNFIEYVVHSNLPLDKATDIEWRVRNSYWESVINTDEGKRKRKDIEDLRIQFIAELLTKQQVLGIVRKDLAVDDAAIQLYDMVSGLTTSLLYIPLADRPARLRGLNAFLNSLYV